MEKISDPNTRSLADRANGPDEIPDPIDSWFETLARRQRQSRLRKWVREAWESAKMDAGYEKSNGNEEPWQVLAARSFFGMAVRGVACGLLGHKWVYEETGDPENGPDLSAHCSRCGRSR